MNDSHQKSIPQDSMGRILLMFAWPTAWYTLLIYVIGRQFIPEGGTTPTWVMMSILALGPGLEMIVGLILLRREGYALTIHSLRDRIRWRWPGGWKAWGVAVIVLILGMVFGMLMGPVNKSLASVPGFVPPDWRPAASNPLKEVKGAADVFPDIALEGNYLFLLAYFLIGLIFNIFGEEIYYRAYLLPRMRGVFGKADWVANGILFTLKHAYQR
ncbi:MAG: CPBP family intramembrane metalloprotease, partial [Anaerolineaceae bacterium]|nr:CPBP family intramembrane metalloprotease [Anaerolineaceae bacterium]